MDTVSKEETVVANQTRKSVYLLLARLWVKEVDAALWQELRAGSLDITTGSPEFDEACQVLGDFVRNNDQEVLPKLSSDYAVLCRGVDRRKGADPYESVHLNKLGLMMQDEWEEVLRFYRRVGLKRAASAVEPEDHLGYELECMVHLCQRGVEALASSDIESYEECLSFQAEMLEGHLLRWVPSFAKKVEKYASTDFYRAIACMTKEYLEMDAGYLDMLQEQIS